MSRTQIRDPANPIRANFATRGELVTIKGGSGVADILAWVNKNAADAYAATPLATGSFQPLDADLTQIAGLADPNADRILFWDDSAGSYAYLAAGSGLAITATTLDVTAAPSSGITVSEGGTPLDTDIGTIDFDGTAFNLTESPENEANVAMNFGTGAGQPSEGNHAHVNDHVAVTVLDTASIDLTLSGQQVSAAAIFGTSATTVAQGNHAHAALYQPLDGDLTAIAGLTSAADKGIQFTGAGTAGTFDLTTAGKALLDDANAAAQLATLGLDADLATFSVPASTTISAFGATLVDDAAASNARTTLELVAGGTGDIWVEKAGDTMTGALSVDHALTVNDSGADRDTRIEGDTDQNLLFVDASTDSIGIGTATPSQWLHLKAGTTARAPLLIPSGTNLTTPVAGAVEFDGAAFYGTHDTTSGRAEFSEQHIFRLTANGGAIGNAIADYFGANSAFPTVASAIYELNYYLWFLKTTAGTVTFTLTNTQTYTNLVAFWEGSVITGIAASGAMSGSGIVTTTSAAAALAATGSLSTAANHFYRIVALAEINVAGNIRLRATESAGTITPLRGSYYTARRLSAGNVGIFAA